MRCAKISLTEALMNNSDEINETPLVLNSLIEIKACEKTIENHSIIKMKFR